MRQKILSSQNIASGRFLVFKELTFLDDRGRSRRWESVDRVGNVAASFIIARIVPDDEFVFVRQFRPPAGKLMLEFPAGLIDPGESPEEAAVRELYEETGYRGQVTMCAVPGYSSPGLTGEPIHMVTMEIDGDACRGKEIVAHPEDSESIECFRVPRGKLAEFIRAQEAEGVGIDSKIYTFLAGMMSR